MQVNKSVWREKEVELIAWNVTLESNGYCLKKI